MHHIRFHHAAKEQIKDKLKEIEEKSHQERIKQFMEYNQEQNLIFQDKLVEIEDHISKIKLNLDLNDDEHESMCS